MKNTTTMPQNTVQTTMSQQSITSLEIILHWFWDETDHEEFNRLIMDMLSVYVEHYNPKSAFRTRNSADMTRFVSECIQLNKLMSEVMHDEKPWDWVDTTDGWMKKDDKGE